MPAPAPAMPRSTYLYLVTAGFFVVTGLLAIGDPVGWLWAGGNFVAALCFVGVFWLDRRRYRRASQRVANTSRVHA